MLEGKFSWLAVIFFARATRAGTSPRGVHFRRCSTASASRAQDDIRSRPGERTLSKPCKRIPHSVSLFIQCSSAYLHGFQEKGLMTETKTSYATCPLCEATCGLEIVIRGREILSIKGDARDVFSHGYICPKAYSLKELHDDPDVIREPMVRRGDQWHKVSWDEAFAEA